MPVSDDSCHMTRSFYLIRVTFFFIQVKFFLFVCECVVDAFGGAGPRSAVGRAPDSSGNILSFLLPLFQEAQLSVTSESMCTKYWLTA